MLNTGSSKYLQLPAHDSTDIGKPSPLALLAATCQRIGAGSPRPSQPTMKYRPSSPSPSIGKPEQPTRRPTPPLVSAPVRSPIMAVSPVEREAPAAVSTSPAAAYQLPLTPPSSPPQVESKVSPPPPTMMSVPAPVSSPAERLAFPAEHPGHLPLQPVLHMPSLHYSPYTMVVPSITPYSSCVSQCRCTHTPHLPAVHPVLLPASSVSGAPLHPAAQMSPPLSFGHYLHHHDIESRFLSSAGKIKSHQVVKSSERLYRPYELSKPTSRKPVLDEEIIDVVSV
ncbi:pollen-specific leucine-rich repeat extensin-like protein 1 [Lytechinus variegatus]|uniref:pollen-specific leucine-rich repeat extensin-like protein 1 n=1 Tax=Lytechinus variegatus TaxID=7654 RepID=UPI001BB2AE84|nr:pollen-specific leucine-rich repeat extensin-like protein 1 [Lytechinus variegatus]